MKIHYRRVLLIGLITAFLGIVLAFSSQWMKEVEHGWFLKIRGQIEAPPEVVIVSINNRAADRRGDPRDTSEWFRVIHADLINRLSERGASVIAFDVAFLDPDARGGDAALASAISNFGRVVLVEKIIQEPVPESDKVIVNKPGPPIDLLRESARGCGPLPVEKGKVSQFSTFTLLGGKVPTLPAVVLQVYAFPLVRRFTELLEQSGFPAGLLPRDADAVKSADDLNAYMRLIHEELTSNPLVYERLSNILASENLSITGKDRRLLQALANLYGGPDSYYLNLYGYPGTVSTISYDAVLDEGAEDRSGNVPDLKGKVVFIGKLETSGPDHLDMHATVFTRDDGVDLSGVEIAATEFANLLTGRMMQRNIPASFIGLIVFGIIAGAIASLVTGGRAIALIFALSAVYFCLAVYLCISRNLWITLFAPVAFQAPVALFMGLFSQYWYAKKEQKRLIGWIPDKIADIPDTGLAFCTCLLTDIRGSRKLSSRLGPKEYKSLMDGYYDAIKKPVIHRGGRIWDFYGDGMMCFFAARQKDTGLRLRASAAAMEILRESEMYNLQQQETSRLPTGIGLHSGWVELGGPQLGDVGNTVSSIEGLNKLLGTRALVSEAVVEGFPGSLSDAVLALDGERPVFARRIGSFLLPGKTDPISIFELIAPRESAAADGPSDENICSLLELSAAALAEFECQSWRKAAGIYERILALCPGDGPARFFLGKCREYSVKQPPYSEASIIRA